MNRLFFIAVTCVFFLITCKLQAQTVDGAIRIGGHLGYGTDIESLGIGVRGDYAVTPSILIAPDFMYFFGDDDFGIDIGWWDINLNGNYLVQINNPDLMPYALAGLNVANTSIDCNGILGSICEDSNNTELGFNLGGGVDYTVGMVVLFGELRVVLGKADQLVFMGGIKYPLN
jgi:outer membrane protein X